MSVKLKNKSLTIKIFPLALILAVFAGFWFAKSEVEKNPEEIKTGRIEISGVWVNDFLKEVDSKKTFVTIVKNKNYHIFFLPKQKGFVISITSSPFEKQRNKAEEEFLKALGIDKGGACKLNVDVTTPSFANPEEAGRIFKLSFCQN